MDENINLYYYFLLFLFSSELLHTLTIDKLLNFIFIKYTDEKNIF